MSTYFAYFEKVECVLRFVRERLFCFCDVNFKRKKRHEEAIYTFVRPDFHNDAVCCFLHNVRNKMSGVLSAQRNQQGSESGKKKTNQANEPQI